MSVVAEFGDKDCLHSNLISKSEDISVCADCGYEIINRLTNDPSNFYRDKDQGSISYDPTRHTIKHNTETGIMKELVELKVNYVFDINNVFNQLFATNGDKNSSKKINRGDNRRCLILACIKYVYDINKEEFDEAFYIKKLDITRRDASKGIRLLSLNRKKIKDAPTIIKSPVSKAREYIKKLDKLKENQNQHFENIAKIYDTIKNKSKVLNGAQPVSISCGLIYYYLKEIIDKNTDTNTCEQITDISEIHKISGTSTATIKKIYDEIKTIVSNIKN